MLEPAIKYEVQTKEKFRGIWFDERYKFFNCSDYYEERKIDDSTWNRHQFVSIRNGEVIGYIGYAVGRTENDVSGLAIVNFEEKPSLTFSKDLGQALCDIFEKFRFRRLEFSVIVGNPIKKSYDRLCQKYGGKIVGTHHKRQRLIDGKLYDQKYYEIFADDYFAAKKGGK